MNFRSKNEEEFYQILVEIFPHTHIEHDYYLGRGLMLDFYIGTPNKIGFEVDGSQHYLYNFLVS
jgi:hypothetical protein